MITLSAAELGQIGSLVEYINEIDYPGVELAVWSEISLSSPDGNDLGRLANVEGEWQFTQATP